MKKSTVLHTIILVLGISLAAHVAGAQKVTFGPGSDWDGSSSGFVVINKTPTGAIEATIEIQIRNAASESVYEVWSEQNYLDTFTTNKKGHGHVHEMLRASTPEEPGKKKKKQEEIKEAEEKKEKDPGKKKKKEKDPGKKKKKQEEIEEEEEEEEKDPGKKKKKQEEIEEEEEEEEY